MQISNLELLQGVNPNQEQKQVKMDAGNKDIKKTNLHHQSNTKYIYEHKTILKHRIIYSFVHTSQPIAHFFSCFLLISWVPL